MLSARTGAGLPALEEAVLAAAGVEGEPAFTARERHVEALRRALACVQAGQAQLDGTGSGELLAEDLREAHAALGEIQGAMTADDLLGAIFGSFCIGK